MHEEFFTMMPQSIYEEWGFHDDVVVLDQLAQLAEANSFELMADGSVYQRAQGVIASASNGDFAARLQALFTHINQTANRIAPCFVGILQNARVRHSVIMLERDGRAGRLYETFRQCDRHALPVFTVEESLQNEAALPETDRLYCYLGSVGSANYGHWLVDDLARVLPAMEYAARIGRTIEWLLPSYGEPVDGARHDSLMALIRDPRNIAFVDRNTTYASRELLYAGPVSYHPYTKSPEALSRLRKRLAPDTPAGTKLFVIRGSGGTRKLLNEAEVSAMLGSLNYKTIDPGQMTFQEQRSAFADATDVVGIMGAGMTNTVFLAAGARVTYLAPDGWVEPFFWDLASVMGHDYRCLFGASVAKEMPSYMWDFEIDIPRLKESLTVQ
jgi:hypothetical protein